jgi:hypothetical protein
LKVAFSELAAISLDVVSRVRENDRSS